MGRATTFLYFGAEEFAIRGSAGRAYTGPLADRARLRGQEIYSPKPPVSFRPEQMSRTKRQSLRVLRPIVRSTANAHQLRRTCETNLREHRQ